MVRSGGENTAHSVLEKLVQHSRTRVLRTYHFLLLYRIREELFRPTE